jgi:hypothetical protein
MIGACTIKISFHCVNNNFLIHIYSRIFTMINTEIIVFDLIAEGVDFGIP